jgi:hypothetical protein
MCNKGSRIVERTIKGLDLYGDYLTIYGWMGAPSHGQPRGPYDRRVDLYVLIWAAVAVVACVSAIWPVPVWLAALIFVVSVWRILELFAFHLRLVLSGTGRRGGLLTVASSHRSVLLFLINYLEVAIWFAADYSLLAHCGVFKGSPHWLSILRESLAMMVANTTQALEINDSAVGAAATWVLFIAHTVVGLFLTLVMVGRIVAYLPTPKEDDGDPET